MGRKRDGREPDRPSVRIRVVLDRGGRSRRGARTKVVRGRMVGVWRKVETEVHHHHHHHRQRRAAMLRKHGTQARERQRSAGTIQHERARWPTSFFPSFFLPSPFSFMAEEWIHPERKIERGIFAEISLSLSSGIECQLEESGVN